MTVEQNTRRFFLIHKKYIGPGLADKEEKELADLQQIAAEHQTRMAPMPPLPDI